MTSDAAQTDADGIDGDTGATVAKSNGAVFHALHDLLDPIADEAKLRVRDDGLHTTVVGPANVAMVDLHFPADAFDVYDFGGNYVAGVNIAKFGGAVGFAHKGQGPDGGDPVTLTLSPDFDKAEVEVVREDGELTMQERWHLIDPDAMRQEPDLPDVPLSATADPSTKTLRDGLKYLYQTQDYGMVRLQADPDDPTTLTMVAEGDHSKGTLRFPEAVYPDEDGDGARSLYSLSYLVDMAKAVHLSRMSKVTLNWGPEYPVKLQFQSEDWGVEGTYMLAPRIQSD